MTMGRRWMMGLVLALVSARAEAILGGSEAEHPAVVMLTGQNGFCSGTLIDERVVLTAAHCLHEGQQAVLTFGPNRQPVITPLVARVLHPNYRVEDWRNGRTSIDLALVKTSEAIAGHRPVAVLPLPLPAIGTELRLLGFGPSREAEATSAGKLRSASLTVTGHPSRFQVRLRGAQGACTGDSGGPALLPQDERVIGVISWTMGSGKNRCGALTGFVPLAPHHGWISETLKRLREN